MIRLAEVVRGSFGAGRLVGPILVLWASVEGLALLMPLVVPDRIYLDGYRRDGMEAAVEDFLAGRGALVPDAVSGWRSAPHLRPDNWVTDADGARVTGREGWDRPDVTRILALGSSMMNGATGVTNQETITAYLERGAVRTKNFGTMLYGVDQMLLDFEARLSGMGADVVLVGLDPDPYGPLGNVYVPLRTPDEVNMPFVKPRFLPTDGGPRLIEVDPATLLVPSGRERLIDLFEAYDRYAVRFESYKHLSMTPALATVAWTVAKARGLRERFVEDEAGVALLDDLMARMQEAVDDAGARLCFVVMPPGLGAGNRLPFEPDLYRRRVERWKAPGYCLVDGLAALDGAGAPAWELYGEDGSHLSALGNRVLADEILRTLNLSDPDDGA